VVPEKQEKVMSREKILAAVSANQPEPTALPRELSFDRDVDNPAEQFKAVATAIGTKIVTVASPASVAEHIPQLFPHAKRIVSMVGEEIPGAEAGVNAATEPHSLEDVDVAILSPVFAVAENSASWLTEQEMGNRILPFICQHLVFILPAQNILSDMHQAYRLIADKEYGFAAFIAGPSKTADIEQSLVLGAHGPRSLTIFLAG
jgi:L-lactate dehydrogenase complex protein LldG